MNIYQVTMRHDSGTYALTVSSDDETGAALTACQIEGAPLRSVRRVKFVKHIEGNPFIPIGN